jgi:hypothetical protein
LVKVRAETLYLRLLACPHCSEHMFVVTCERARLVN